MRSVSIVLLTEYIFRYDRKESRQNKKRMRTDVDCERRDEHLCDIVLAPTCSISQR